MCLIGIVMEIGLLFIMIMSLRSMVLVQLGLRLVGMVLKESLYGMKMRKVGLRYKKDLIISEFYSYYGDLGVCYLLVSGSAICRCLQGFKQKDKKHRSSGCKRITPLKGDQRNGNDTQVSNVGDDGFLERKCMKLPDFANVVDTKDCEGNCLGNASCTAYAEVVGIGCMIWYGDLVDVQHFECGGIGNTWQRLAHSDLGKVMVGKPKCSSWTNLPRTLYLYAWYGGTRENSKLHVAVSSASCCKNSDVLPLF